ncbi:class I SAM-dependent methyltransferase [Hymenobacter busanensis]|uniref:Class I SAM-dependent methyltransferase n=1 Tax=Hymenobacter busanensis TaxID=2607656 RepID=A0A7L4ZVE1_9BACT|nr:class I SAM-dependent methyltransferase [Hymenobacter busanensis]KAA9332481.1 class I SAM-dependent methyltransferase [Hymenobacter busanensis]QHJ07181.1 hypothetical protein GUY19_07755 [Hymenobacter busanensis]
MQQPADPARRGPASHLRRLLGALAAQSELLTEAHFAARADCLDQLELLLLPEAEAGAGSAPLSNLRRRGRAWQARLEAVNQQFFQRLQAEIRAGQHSPPRMRQLLTTHAGRPTSTVATRYDHLDALTDGLFPEPGALPEPESRDPEMVYYQKTPARIILELAARLAPSDVLYDLGSGLGQVPLLVHLLSGATTRGIEIEPAYCRYAQACAAALNLPQVQFRCADARTADFADATAFYLFTPFTGSIMQQVLARLRELAQMRPLRLFSYGPSTGALNEQPWLLRVGEEGHLYQLAEFRSEV